MAMIAAGRLRDLVTVREYSQTTNEIGGQSSTVETRSIWSCVKAMNGSRSLEYAQIVEGVPYEVYIRYFDQPDLKTGDQIVYNGLTLTVHSLIEQDESYAKFIAVQRNT